MDYIANNRAAWEEAFENRKPGWGEDNHTRLQEEDLPFFNEDTRAVLRTMDFNGKTVAQFCCNNGRELLSLMQLGADRGVGFDFARNIIEQARGTATKTGIENCHFEVCNVLDVPNQYYGQFDFIFFTIGGLAWFDDLSRLFEQVSRCLKSQGTVLINDHHPFFGMLPQPGDDEFDLEDLRRLAFSYFTKEPWTSTQGMGYMTVSYDSKPFTSFSHTFSEIINALSINGISTVLLNEYDYDIGLTDVYDHSGLPLSYILVAEEG